MIKFDIHTGAHQVNLYQVSMDGHPWCFTSNDDDGFKLQVAIGILKQQQGPNPLVQAVVSPEPAIHSGISAKKGNSEGDKKGTTYDWLRG